MHLSLQAKIGTFSHYKRKNIPIKKQFPVIKHQIHEKLFQDDVVPNLMKNISPLRIAHTKIRRILPIDLRSNGDYFFFTFVFFGVIFLILLSPWLSHLGKYQASKSSLICAFVLLFFGILWYRGLKLVWAQLGYELTLMVTILYNVILDGGVTSSMMVWLSIVPLLPLFVLSRAWGVFWLMIAFFSVLAICFLQIKGWVPVAGNETPNELATSATMYAILCITQLLLVLTYDSASSTAMRKVAKQNKQLTILSNELRKANAHKDKFLATVSHELRTPLNAVMGYLGLIIGEKNVTPEVYAQAEHAKNASEHLLTVINDLLDYSQIQQGQLVLTPQVIDVRKTLMAAHQSLLPKAQDKGLRYQISLSDHLPQHMRLDPHRLTQILLNLLGNAIKFTDKGNIFLEVDYIQNSKNQKSGILVLIVKDTGCGIAEDDIEKAFEPFVQLSNPSSSFNLNALKGNGLGLSITRSLICSWNGKLKIESKVGIGTTFTVNLPIETASNVPNLNERAVLHTLPESLNLLLVDDHHINRMVARATILRTLPNVNIDEAVNGTDAFDKMSTKLYDLVLMDLVMPDMTGTEVVYKIRQETPKPYCDVSVVAFTANVSEDAVQACKAVGMESMLPKPFNADALISTIRQYAV